MEFDQIIDDVINMSATFFDDDDDEIIIDLMRAEQFSRAQGSLTGRNPNIERNFRAGHQRLMEDYFNDGCTYDEKHFVRRFRMSKEMFLRITDGLEKYDNFFKWRCDAAGKIGLSPVQKCTTALRMLAYGASASSLDENLRIGESTALLRKFCSGVINVFGSEFLLPPAQEEIKKLMEQNSKRGFPGMIGSIDCMHWAWKNCPVALQGQYQGKDGKPTLLLEAVASHDTYIWHCFFGCPGSCNDINVLDRSPIVNDIVQNNFLGGQWSLGGKQYSTGYLLADKIYPDWTVFMKTISQPQSSKEKYYAKMQESLRKDVERCFGILQACWQILVVPCRMWDSGTMRSIIITCIILHNMRIRSKVTEAEIIAEDWESQVSESAGFEASRCVATLSEACETRAGLKNSLVHHELQNDLVNRLWMTRGDFIG